MLVDSAGFIAVIGECRDEALTCLSEIEASAFPAVVTTAIVAETHRHLLFNYGAVVAGEFLDKVLTGRFQLIATSFEDLTDATSIVRRYHDQGITLCDALSFSTMKRLGILRAFTFDHRHFWLLGFVTVPPL